MKKAILAITLVLLTIAPVLAERGSGRSPECAAKTVCTG